MSQGKFAAITAGLLARKGEAEPWQDAMRKSLDWRSDVSARMPPTPQPEAIPPRVAAPAHIPAYMPAPSTPPSPEAVKKCTVKLSQRDYERLGILAVKRNITRQHLLQDAMAQVLNELARALESGCACLAAPNGACRGTDCRDT